MIICDNCTKEFELKPITKKLNDGIYEVYFKCPHCSEKYNSYFTNKNIRIKQKNINKMWEIYKNAKTQEEVVEMVTKIDSLKASIKADMESLKKKMLGA